MKRTRALLSRITFKYKHKHVRFSVWWKEGRLGVNCFGCCFHFCVCGASLTEGHFEHRGIFKFLRLFTCLNVLPQSRVAKRTVYSTIRPSGSAQWLGAPMLNFMGSSVEPDLYQLNESVANAAEHHRKQETKRLSTEVVFQHHLLKKMFILAALGL